MLFSTAKEQQLLKNCFRLMSVSVLGSVAQLGECLSRQQIIPGLGAFPKKDLDTVSRGGFCRTPIAAKQDQACCDPVDVRRLGILRCRDLYTELAGSREAGSECLQGVGCLCGQEVGSSMESSFHRSEIPWGFRMEDTEPKDYESLNSSLDSG